MKDVALKTTSFTGQKQGVFGVVKKGARERLKSRLNDDKMKELETYLRNLSRIIIQGETGKSK